MGSNSTNKFRKVPVFLFFIFYLTLSLRPAIGQITPRSPGRSAASGGPSLIIDRQPEVTTGDMLIAAISYSDDDPGNNLDIAATATGWTVIDDRVFSVSGDNEWRAALLYRVADGSESSTFTFNLDPDTDGAIGIITTYFGVDVTGGVKADGSPGGPFDADPANLTLFGSGSLNTPGITTTTGFALVIFQGFIAGASSVVNNSWSATNPASFSELYDLNTTLGADQTVAAATRERNTAGFTGIGTATTGTSAANASILFALKAIPVSPMAQLGCDGRFYLSYTNATGQYATTNMNRISFSGDIITETPFIVNPTNIPFNGIGLAPNTGFLQGFSNPISSIRSIRIGDYIPSGNLEIQGSFSHPQIAPADQVYAGCYDANNNLYFITSANKFFSNTSPSLIATLTPVSGPFIDIAVDPTDGQMYGTAGTGLTNKNLYKINTSTGALTLVNDYNNGSVEVIAGLLFDEEGHLFGYSSFGRFLQIDKTTAALTELGNSLQGYLDGDACSCPFKRVYHTLAFAAAPANIVCPTAAIPQPVFPITVSVINQHFQQLTGLTYTLSIQDPAKRFRFAESAATIKSNLILAGLATPASVVTLTAESPATGTDYNKLVVTDFQTGLSGETKNFPLQVQLYSLGGIYLPVPLQSSIQGLPVEIGSVDLSNDPDTNYPDDPTLIYFCPGISLPVDFTSFTLVKDRSTIVLRWETAMEINNHGFAVERNSNGSWQQIAWVPSQAPAGNSNALLSYTYTDINTHHGVSLYRIRQTDFNGKSKYSEIRFVRGDGLPALTMVYPNPASSGKLNFIFDNAKVSRDITVFDIAGRRIQQYSSVRSTNMTIDNLKPGIYIIRVNVTETGEQFVEKVIMTQ